MKKAVLVTGACINTGVAIVEKFAREGWQVVFTGRNKEKVAIAQENYRKKYPNAEIFGYAICSLIDERTVDEPALEKFFAWANERGISFDCVV